MLERAVDAGDGDVLVLDADRGFALDAEVAGEVVADAAGNGAEAAVVAVQVGVADRAGPLRVGEALSKRRRSKKSKSGGREKNVTQCFYPLDVATSTVTSPIQRETNGRTFEAFQRLETT